MRKVLIRLADGLYDYVKNFGVPSSLMGELEFKAFLTEDGRYNVEVLLPRIWTNWDFKVAASSSKEAIQITIDKLKSGEFELKPLGE